MPLDVQSGTGTKIYISGAITPTTDTAAEYTALTWVEIGLTESIGEYGDESASVNFTGLADARVRKGKGARDAGSTPIVVAQDPTDVGQQAMIAAEKTTSNFGFKVVFPNRITQPSGADETHYFRALVMSRRKSGAQTDNVRRQTFNLGINSEILELPPT